MTEPLDENLLVIARCQRGVVVCLLAYLSMLFAGTPFALASRFLLAEGASLMHSLLAVLTLMVFIIGVLVISAASAIQLAFLVSWISRPWLGVVAGVLAILPGINILLMATACAIAARILRRSGIAVNWLGADVES